MSIIDNITAAIGLANDGHDSSGSTHGFTNIGTTTFNGTSAAFNGSSQAIEYPTFATLFGSTGTLSFWTKATNAFNSSTIESPFGSWDGSTKQFVFLHYSDNNMYFGWNYTGTDKRVVVAASSGNWSTSVFNHYMFTWVNGGNSKLYVNGSQVGSTMSGTVAGDTGAPFSIGATGRPASIHQDYFTGSIQKFLIYSDEKSSGDATTLYNSGTPLTWEAMVASVRSGTTYYFATGGSDSNNGTTTGTPFQTISKANTLRMAPGDTFLFNKGDTFSGNLLINPLADPSSGAKVTVDAYGSGANPIISPSNSYGIRIRDAGYVVVKNLTVSGPTVSLSGTYPSNRMGTTTSTNGGIELYQTTLDNWYDGVNLDGVEVDGCLYGLLLQRSDHNATAGYRTMTWNNLSFNGCGVAGISSSRVDGSSDFLTYTYKVTATNITVQNVYGISAYDFGFGSPPGPYGTGYGLLLTHFADSTFDGVWVSNCGEAAAIGTGGGPVGIMYGICDNVVAKNFRVYNQKSPDADGFGLDFDLATTNCMFDHGFVYGCRRGLGFGADSNPHTGNTIRYVVFEQNILADVSDFSGTFSNIEINNCTFYRNATTGTAIFSTKNVNVRNCILYVDGGDSFGSLTAGTNHLNGNNYGMGGGSGFSFVFGATTYTSLSQLHTDGFEKNASSTNVGATGDPVFSSAGNGHLQAFTASVASLSAYDVSGASAAHGCGADLSGFSITQATTDLHGNASATLDAGALTYGSTAPVADTSSTMLLMF